MSRIGDILAGVEAKLRTAFPRANIYRREELSGDELPDPESFYIQPLNPERVEMPFVVDFRRYPVRVTCAFREDARAKDEEEVDVLIERKAEISDAMKAAVGSIVQGDIANVYQVDFRSPENLNPELPAGTPAGEEQERVQRISQDWDFYTYED